MFLPCTSGYTLLSQTIPPRLALDERLCTFDRLTKTIISFSSPEEPHISVTPLPRSPYSIKALGNGRYELHFESRIGAGTYSIKVSSGTETKECVWKVLRSQLHEQNWSSISTLQCYFGCRCSLRSRLPVEAELPREQFKINVTIGDGPSMVDAAYAESWFGPRIPASAKTVRIDVVWVYPPTGERVPLLSKTMIPIQEPPELDCINAQASFANDSTLRDLEKKGKISRSKERLAMLDSSRLQEIFFTVKGIRMHKEVPIDADSRDPIAQKVLFAQAENVEIMRLPSIQHQSPSSNLSISADYSGGETRPFAITTTSTRCVDAGFLPNEKELYAVVAVIVPTFPIPETRILKGVLEFQQQIQVVNRKAGVSAPSYVTPCFVKIAIPYDRNTSKVEWVNCWSSIGAARPPEEKTPNLPAEEICAHCSEEKSTIATNAKKASVYHAWKVLSPALHDEIQAIFVQAGKMSVMKPLPSSVPLVVIAKKNAQFPYSLVALRFGEHVLTPREIQMYVPSSIQTLLRSPIIARLSEAEDSVVGTKKGYLYGVLSEGEQSTMLAAAREAIFKETCANLRQNLRSIRNYELGGFALFEADSVSVARFRETFTPSLPRTQGLEEAEKMCLTTKRIIAQIEAGQRVPQAWIDEGGSPQDCEVVKLYHTTSYSLVRIDKVMLLVNVRANKPEILAAVSVSMPKNICDSLESTILHDCLLAPLSTGCLLGEDLRQFTTTEFEKDAKTGEMIAVKGAITQSQHSTMYEHLFDKLKQGRLRERTLDVMPLPAMNIYRPSNRLQGKR